MKNHKTFYSVLIKNATMIVFIIGFLGNLSANTIIEGEFDKKVKIDSFSISYTTNQLQEYNIYSFGVKKVIQVVNGKFTINLEDVLGLFYIHFHLPKVDHEHSGVAIEFFKNFPILLHAESNSRIFISSSSIEFIGKDQSLFDAQQDLFTIYKSQNRLENEEIRNINKLDKVNLKTNVFKFLEANNHIQLESEGKADSLLSLKYSMISAQIRNQLWYDYIGHCRLNNLRMLNFKAMDPEYGEYVTEYYLKHFLNDVDSMVLNGYLGKSAIFPAYLAAKIRLDLKMGTAVIQNGLKFNLPVLLEMAYLKYTGRLYDQVTFASFLNWRMTNPIEEGSYRTLLSTLQDCDLVHYVKEDMRKSTFKERSFQFRLINEKGYYVSNKDLSGKVVLIDFWFTGCGGCLTLHKKIQPVKEYFKNNPNIEFVSINVDPKEESWKRSIASGNYTDEEDTKLWTGGGETTHPMVRHYNIASYPTMVLVNANDELVMLNPPNPRNSRGLKELIYLIERTIQEKD